MSLAEAERSPYAAEWKAAKEDEDQSMQERKVFHYVLRPKDARVIGSRYIYQIKTDYQHR